MKKKIKSSYYTVPKFVVTMLQLESGPLRDIYSIIYGFSQDGESGCECTRQYFEEWTLQSRSTVQRCLGELIASGLVKVVRVGMGRGSYNRYMANLEILDEIEKGFKLTPFLKGSKMSKKGFKNEQKRVQIDADTSYKNNIIIYKNISFARTRDTRTLLEEEKKNFYTLFFFKNCSAPQSEVEAFIRVNELAGWVDTKGRPLDSPKKRLLWADGWKVQGDQNRVNSYFLDVWKAIYNETVRRGDAEMAELMLDTRIKCESSKQIVLLTMPAAVRDYIEARADDDGQIWGTLKSFVSGRRLSYQDLVL